MTGKSSGQVLPLLPNDSSDYCAISCNSGRSPCNSKLWAPANQVPNTDDFSLVSGCDAIKEHRSGKGSLPVERCAVSLLRYGGAEGKERSERLGELGAEDTDVCCELEDEAQARTDSQTIEGAHPGVSSGCPN